MEIRKKATSKPFTHDELYKLREREEKCIEAKDALLIAKQELRNLEKEVKTIDRKKKNIEHLEKKVRLYASSVKKDMDASRQRPFPANVKNLSSLSVPSYMYIRLNQAQEKARTTPLKRNVSSEYDA